MPHADGAISVFSLLARQHLVETGVVAMLVAVAVVVVQVGAASRRSVVAASRCVVRYVSLFLDLK